MNKYNPTLCLIFANHREEDEKDGKDCEMELMREVIDFERRIKLPCHVVGQRVLFYHNHVYGSSEAIVHSNTAHHIIQELEQEGFWKDKIEEDTEDEIDLFKRKLESVIKRPVLPVIISIKNGGMQANVLERAAISKIPIIRFKKNTSGVSVITPETFTKQGVKMKEYKTEVNNPWDIVESESDIYKIGNNHENEDHREITLMSEIDYDLRMDFHGLICSLLIGVLMKEDSLEKEIYGCHIGDYINALSMYLLKQGKWNIPHEHFNYQFSYRSIEYIYEMDIKSIYEDKEWQHLKKLTNKTCKDHEIAVEGGETPDNVKLSEKEMEKEMKVKRGRKYSFLGTGEPKKKGETTDNIELLEKDMKKEMKARRSNMSRSMGTDESKKKGSNAKDFELYGLIFLALLLRKQWTGAKQLVEKGFIGIRHLLIACVILDEKVKDVDLDKFERKGLLRLKSEFSQIAIRITSNIDEKCTEKTENDDNPHKKHLGKNINHAERLLLNEGYIQWAIKKQNKDFINNNEVKKILNRMWYGTEDVDYKTILGYVCLVAVHLFVMPLLMVNMEHRPLLWLYKKYNLPIMKLLINMIGFLCFLIAYAYMLLFDYRDNGITYSDYFIIAWMASFAVDEMKQYSVAIKRSKWKHYASIWWNRIDWLSITAYFSGLLYKLCEGNTCRNLSKLFLVLAFMLLCIRVLNFCCITEILGTQLVMIQHMFQDTFAFMVIMTIIMMCYNISFHALMYSNTEFSWLQIEKIAHNGFWILFGKLEDNSDSLTVPDCTFNKTIYEIGVLERCPTQLGKLLTPYLKAVYCLVAVVLLLNLLIAMYSDTFQKVHQETEFYWSQLQTDFLEEYSIKTAFPIHLQLLVIPATVVHAVMFVCYHFLRSKTENETNLDVHPMFVRVFLYNTNFDLKLDSTHGAEWNETLKTNRTISTFDDREDTIEKRKLYLDRKKTEKMLNENNEKIMNKLQEIEKSLKELQKSLKIGSNPVTEADVINEHDEEERTNLIKVFYESRNGSEITTKE